MSKKTNNPIKSKVDSNSTTNLKHIDSKKRKKTWLSIFDKNATWEDKDEVLDAVYWFRQVLALVMGLIWGYLGLTGIISIIAFAIINSIAAYGLANNTGYDFDPDESYASVKEGFMTTFATFLVTWIVTYSSVHFGHQDP